MLLQYNILSLIFLLMTFRYFSPMKGNEMRKMNVMVMEKQYFQTVTHMKENIKRAREIIMELTGLLSTVNYPSIYKNEHKV